MTNLTRFLTLSILSIAIILGYFLTIDPEIPIRIKVTHLFVRAVVRASNWFEVNLFEVANEFTPTIPSGKGHDNVTAEDITIPSLHSSVFEGITPLESVRVRVFYRDEIEQRLPIVIAFHGGAYIFGNATSKAHDGFYRTFAREGPFIVISVDYRLAPKYPLPAAIDDSVAAVIWAHQSSHPILKRYGDSSKLILIGDSAGGGLVASVAQFIHNNRPEVKIAAQVLIYPYLLLSFDQQTESLKKFKDGYIFFEECSLFAEKLRLPNNTEFVNSYLCQPMHGTNFAGQPTAHFVVAEYDRLHDEGILYFNKLKDAGVSVSIKSYSTIHGFLTFDYLPEAQQAIQDLLKVMREIAQ